MLSADKGQAAKLDGDGLVIGIVQARFNAALTDKITQACRYELAALGVAERHTTHVTVPGALEIAVRNAIPLGNAILTVDTEAQAWERVEDKGRDSARVAVEMANLMSEL